MNVRKSLFLIAAVALVPLLPLALFGYAGQDFEFHATCWLALHDARLAGTIAPLWDPRANFGLGDPHLALYPPGAMYAGAFLTLLLPFRFVPAAFLWLAIFAAGATMYYAARDFLAPRDRLAAALLYMLSPYLLTTALVRFAAGELLVQAALPLIVLFFFRAVWTRNRQAPFLLALLLGLSWFTNIPESIVLLYCLVPVAVLCAWMQRSAMPLLRMLLAEALALLLAAFYLAPLWVERAFINQPGLTRLDPRHLLLFMPGSPAEPLKIFKWSCWLFACAGCLVVLACLRRRAAPWTAVTRATASLALLAFFFQLPLALLLWRILPEMAAIAFPFRFLPLMGVTLPLLLLAPGTRPTLRKPVYAIVALLSLVPVAEHIRTQTTPSTRMAPFAELTHRWTRDGYEGMPEFVPPGVTRPSAPLQLQPSVAAGSHCTLTSFQQKTTELDLSVSSTAGCNLLLPVYFYPYWSATDQTGTHLATTSGTGSLLQLAAPPGEHRIRIFFLAHSLNRVVSRIVSLAALLLILLALLQTRRATSRPELTA